MFADLLRRYGLSASVVVLLALACSAASSTTISSFPYTPNDSTLASDFSVNSSSGPTAAGSSWSNGTTTSPRCGSSGVGDQAWAVRPNGTANNGTVTWLDSPVFDFSSLSGHEMKFELWISTATSAGMKVQVSTNGGSSYSDVSAFSVSYTSSSITLLGTKFGGGNSGWNGTTYGGGSATTVALDLNAWSGQSDVRFRWCFVTSALNLGGSNHVVVDSVRVVPVTGSVAYASGYAAVPQGATVSATVVKSGGSAFTSGMSVSFAGSGVSGSVTSVTSADVCDVSFTAARCADVGAQVFYIDNGSTHYCQGIVSVFWPQQLIGARQGGSALEPPQNAAMGANGVYLHNGEFRHDLPIVSIPGRMLPLSIGLTYRSQADTIGPVGAGWFASFDKRLYYSSGSDQIELHSGDGRIDTFTLQSGGSAGVGPYIKAGFFLNITRDNNGTSGDATDDTFTIHYAHGSTAVYGWTDLDVSNRDTYREFTSSDRYGNTVTSVYDAGGCLLALQGDLYDAGVSTTRHKLTFAYNAHGRLDTIEDYADYSGQSGVIGGTFTGHRKWEFVYNSDAQLTEIRLPKTEQYYSNTKGSTYRTRVQFTYDINDNMLEVIDARQANESSPYGWLQNHFDGSDRVDYQDVGRSSSGDTGHRQNIVYGSVDINGRWKVNVINALSYRTEYQVQVTSGSNPLGTCNYVRAYTGEWNTSLSQTASAIRGTDPSYFETSFLYDSEFHCVQVTRPRGNLTRFLFDTSNSDRRSRGNLLRVLSHRGSLSSGTLPSDQANGLLAKFTYTSASQFNLLATSVGPRAFELKSSYDIATDNPSDYDRDDSAYFTTTYTYTFGAGAIPDGTLASVTSPTVDSTRSPDTLNNGQVLSTAYTYNFPFGQLTSVTDDAGVVTTYVYGTSGFEKGLLTQVKAGDQTMSPLITQFAYNSVGRAIMVTDPRGYDWVSYVNQLDQVVKAETPQVTLSGTNRKYYTLSEYDHNGNVSAFKVSDFSETGAAATPSTIDTTYTYNILDMVTSVTEPIDLYSSRTTSFAFDAIYRSTETTLPEGNKSASDYDEVNRAIKSYFGFDGSYISKGSALVKGEAFYDENSNTTSVKDGAGNAATFTFDAYDRCIKAQDRLPSSAGYTEFTYNQSGQVTLSVRYGKRRQFNGIAYAFAGGTNELGRAESRFDNLGRAYFSRVRAKDHDLSNNLGYSSFESVPSGASDGWSTSRVKFTQNGLVDFTEGDLRYPTKYSYDSFNRLYRVTDDRDGGGSADNFDEYGYDANGNVTSVRAVLYDDRAPGSPAKDVTTHFYFDEVNRLIEDQSPVVNGSALHRYFEYDSRSNCVKTTDRKGQVRRTEFDFLGRATRFKVENVSMREINASTGYVSTVSKNIVSLVKYDKNSNVLQRIDPTGNRTYSRHDMAGRWLQTQHADGGTPLKTSAGTTHSVSQFGSTNFWSGTSAYDANGNLLNMLDENGTLRTFTYDENSNLLSETGTVAGGNPFNIEGETGLSYLYDGLYRSVFGETHDGTGTLTDTESVFNTLGGLERQQQRVLRAHPSQPTMTTSGTVVSEFDESGRRFGRRNPGDITWTRWAFDRKHRPTEAWLVYGGTWTGAVKISDYQYLGGGLLHSRHVKYMNQPVLGGNMVVPIVSDFERDDLLRLTSVRHWRDDFQLGAGRTRLLGRYDYLYDENSMMRYEARWHEHDFAGGTAGASTVPDETDFYFYASDNQLEKAAYNVTEDRAGAIDLASINWSYFADDTNWLNCSDRVTYGRRVTGTRQRVNWYRGSPTRSGGAAPFDETGTAPTQKTHYDNTEDTTKDPDNPASDGAGSRHNYTVIGQTSLTYDNNRNVLADGTREFRYSYNNQLRRVWRKSDGDAAGEGLLAKYREDAFGRRVYAESYWELSRRDTLDTRFSVDINMDADADSTEMEYVNGGITSTASPAPGQNDQVAQWDSRIRRPITNTNESHYFDFDVTVPAGGEEEYMGFIAYGYFELWIFTDRYELWDTTGPTLIGAQSATTAGRHNIGLRAGQGWGVWVDGTQLTLTGGSGSMGLIAAPRARFGTHVNSAETALTLWENLCYLRAYNRGVSPEGGIPASGDPVVNVCQFDGPRVTVIDAVYDNATSNAICVSLEGGDRHESLEDGELIETIELPLGRMHTGVVISQSRDLITNTGTGTRIDMSGDGDPMPGVVYEFHLAADGAIGCFGRFDPSALLVTPCYGPATASHDWTGQNHFFGLSIQQGGGGHPEGDEPGGPDAGVPPPESVSGADIDLTPDSNFNCDTGGHCCARGIDDSCCGISAATLDTSTGAVVDQLGGNGRDPYNGAMYSVGPVGPVGIQVLKGKWIGGWDPKDSWDQLTDDNAATLGELLNDGWSFATKTDGTETVGGLKQHDDINVEVKNSDFADRLAKGGKVQWKDDEWAVDWENKVIYIDASEDKVAAEIMNDLLKKVRGAGIDDVDFLADENGWNAFGAKGCEPEKVAKMTRNDIVWQRIQSQIGSLNHSSSIEAIKNAMESRYGAGILKDVALTVLLIGLASVLQSYVNSESTAGFLRSVVESGCSITEEQIVSFVKFVKKLPSKASSVEIEDGVGGARIFKATVPGNVPGSKAVYVKTVDSAGKTTGYTKTTYDPQGKVVGVKDKLDS